MLVSDAFIALTVVVSSCAGALAGFAAGLVPGLHMNNFASAIAACAGAYATGAVHASGFVLPCILCAALTGHMFASAVGGTYLGVPDGDSVSVLPAHRLARAGLGPVAVRSSAAGTVAGVLMASLVLLPVSIILGEPLAGYRAIQTFMLPLIVTMAALLLASTVPRCASARVRARALVTSLTFFLLSGCLGLAVLHSYYSASAVPEVPWVAPSTMSRSALLLPLFAGLFGLPNLVAALGSPVPSAVPRSECPHCSPVPRRSDLALSLLAGTMVGWLPGMTSGTAAATLSPDDGGFHPGEGVERSARFIWRYAATTSAGAVMSVGALLVISRARSGTMDAVSLYMDGAQGGMSSMQIACVLVSSMLVSAALCHWLMRSLEPRLAGDGARRLLSSRWTSLSCIAFLCALCLALTGLRGMLLLCAACLLGVLTMRAGVRRVCLMGCMMVPIAAMYMA